MTTQLVGDLGGARMFGKEEISYCILSFTLYI